MNEHKIKIKSFFKSSPEIIEFILKSIRDNKIYTVKQIKDLILTEYHIEVSTQLIYNILKKIITFIKNLSLIIIHIQ